MQFYLNNQKVTTDYLILPFGKNKIGEHWGDSYDI